MSRLPIISGMEAMKAFFKAGWIPHRQVGSHVVIWANLKLPEKPRFSAAEYWYLRCVPKLSNLM